MMPEGRRRTDVQRDVAQEVRELANDFQDNAVRIHVLVDKLVAAQNIRNVTVVDDPRSKLRVSRGPLQDMELKARELGRRRRRGGGRRAVPHGHIRQPQARGRLRRAPAQPDRRAGRAARGGAARRHEPAAARRLSTWSRPAARRAATATSSHSTHQPPRGKGGGDGAARAWAEKGRRGAGGGGGGDPEGPGGGMGCGAETDDEPTPNEFFS